MHVQNLMNSLWDIRIFLGLVPKESLCILQDDTRSLQYQVGIWVVVFLV